MKACRHLAIFCFSPLADVSNSSHLFATSETNVFNFEDSLSPPQNLKDNPASEGECSENSFESATESPREYVESPPPPSPPPLERGNNSSAEGPPLPPPPPPFISKDVSASDVSHTKVIVI